MGMALIKGFSASEGAKYVKTHVCDIDSAKTDLLRKFGYTICETETEITQKCKYVVLACKPQQLSELLEKIKNGMSPDTVLISLCAGISAEYIRERVGKDAKVILVMPNLPMLLGVGASAIARDISVSDEEFNFVRSIIESCGIAEVIPMDKMNEITCINASAPAFIYLFSKGFADYAAEHGINKMAALKLFSQTLVGSAKMMVDSGYSLDELISQVTSKGGTTSAGMEQLDEGNLEKIVKNACEACTKRAYELGNDK